jgi:hypothetical protein
MEIIAGILALVVIVQEYRYHKLVERMLIQSVAPAHFGPVRAMPPTAVGDGPVEKTNFRKKLFSVKVPE